MKTHKHKARHEYACIGNFDDCRSSGVYAIRNKRTKEVYVGSTTGSIVERLCKHIGLLRKGTHHNKYLQSSFSKYGEGCFRFGVLEIAPPDKCRIREAVWITVLRPAYNTHKSPSGFVPRRFIATKTSK